LQLLLSMRKNRSGNKGLNIIFSVPLDDR